MRRSFFYAATALLILVSSCKKVTEEYAMLPLNDYYPLTVGKYITYSLDSIVYYTNFGVSATVNSYQVKHVVDAAITDNLGRPAFRIIRYIRNTPAAAWQPDNTFTALSSENGIEFTENNLRFLKLVNPIRQDYSWQGNSFINTTSVTSTVKYLNDWDYTYDSINVASTIGSITLDNTIKVAEIDYTDSYTRLISEEKYAKGIGLVYRNFLYQTKSSLTSPYNDAVSYGVVMKMIDHN